MVLLIACKNVEDPIINEEARVVTTLFINFLDAQGQLTLKSVMESCRNSNSSKSMGIFPDAQGQLTHKSLVGSCQISNPFEILWLFLLPARIKKNQSKMKEQEWSQDFPNNSMGAICCHGNQSSDPILPKT